MDDNDDSNPNVKYFNDLGKKKDSFGRRLERRLKRVLVPVVRAVLNPIASLLAARGLRLFVVSHPNRIGHLAVEPDWCLKQIKLGEREDIRPTLLLRSEQAAANRALLDIWSQHMDLITGGWRYKLLSAFKSFPQLTIQGGDAIVAITGAADYPRILKAWGGRAPLVSLSDRQAEIGQEVLAKLGVPEGAWFVCMHVRERGYSPGDDEVQGYRNADIATYAKAAQEIADRGGWVIRMGDATMTPLPDGDSRWSQTVDYALSDLKSPEADIFLCAKARLFLGNTSGLMMVSSIFGVPVALVNMIPYATSTGIGPSDLAIPKLLERDGKRLQFSEIFGSGIGHFRISQLYDDAGLTVIENTPEEICAVAAEALDRLDGTLAEETPDEAERQQQFKSLINTSHYCYHSGGSIGRAFLRDHAELLPGS